MAGNEQFERMRRFLVACAEKANLCHAGDVVFDRDASVFRLGRSSVEVVYTPSEGAKPGWRVRYVYEVPDIRKGGMISRINVIDEAPFGMESSVAKVAVLSAIEMMLDTVVDSVAD